MSQPTKFHRLIQALAANLPAETPPVIVNHLDKLADQFQETLKKESDHVLDQKEWLSKEERNILLTMISHGLKLSPPAAKSPAKEAVGQEQTPKSKATKTSIKREDVQWLADTLEVLLAKEGIFDKDPRIAKLQTIQESL